MNLTRKLRFCPQPKTLPTKVNWLSAPIFTFAILAEIVCLLLVPMGYYALLVPKPVVTGAMNQKFPLSNSQIKASWPNLPTIQELKNTTGVGFVTDSTSSTYTNCTVINPLIMGSVGINGKTAVTPSILYDIYLYDGITQVHWMAGDKWCSGKATVWLQVPYTDLATNNPPSIPPQKGGFLNTGLPPSYVAIAALAVSVTLLVGVYIGRQKRDQISDIKVSEIKFE